MDKTSFLYICNRWWWFIVLFVVTSIVASYFIVQTLPKSYQVSTKIFVTSSMGSSLANVNDAPYTDRAVKTVMVLASSSPVKKALSDATSIPIIDLETINIKNISGTQIIEIQFVGKNRDNLVLAAQSMPKVIQKYLLDLQKDIDEKNQIKTSLAEAAGDVTPSGASAIQIYALIAALSFLLAYLFSYLFNITDNSIKDYDDLKKLKLIHLGDFGILKNIFASPSAINRDNNRSVAEMLREVRTNLSLSDKHKNIKTVIVTSSKPKEGKSFLAANLAIMLAETGKKVALIDCDFRSPFVNKIFKVNNKRGLSNYLKDNSERDILIKSQVDNLWLILAGVHQEKTSELLDLKKLTDFKEQLLTTLGFDYIIFDTAPISITSDAAILSKIADGIILAIEKNKTTITDVRRAKDQFEKVGGNIIGAVLTKTKSENKSYGYYSQ